MRRLVIGSVIFFLLMFLGSNYLLEKKLSSSIFMAVIATIIWFLGMRWFFLKKFKKNNN
jgi:hypothetical protein